VNDACRSAGHSTTEVILFHQQGALSGAGTLPRHSHAVDSSADHHAVAVLAVQPGALIFR
jgi:hypothetical protein